MAVVTETVELHASRRRLRFVLVAPSEDGVRRIPIEGTLLVGKHPSNDVVIESQGVSRYHLELRAEPGCVLVRDVGSKNGTFYDGARVTEVRLGPGASFRVGGPAGTELGLESESRPTLAPSKASHFGPLIGESQRMRAVFSLLEKTAAANTTLLVHGETGTGKELVAKAIHAASPRRDKPFVVVDCGSIPSTLIESELFGHTRGAFTDAASDRIGAFESADRGTLFLDEIGELPLQLQPKLLRAVEDRSIQRVGESRRRTIDVRVVAATHRDLKSEVAGGRFRQDLFFRLAVVTVELPPLRERGRDVLLLASHMLAELGLDDTVELDDRLQSALLAYQWPGNVRELRNAIERAAHLGADHAVPLITPPGDEAPADEKASAPDLPFKEAKEQIISAFERAYVVRLLDRHGTNISAAARNAGIDRNYLYRLLKKHGLARP